MKGFISYAHADYLMSGEVQKHLRSIEREFSISFWIDKRISPGFYWNTEIEKAIEEAQVFILLTSPAFIASDYIYDHEIPAIKKRHAAGDALVLPVVLQRCAWQMVAAALQATPTENGKLKPISDWRRHSDGFDRARDQIASAISAYFAVAPHRIDWRKP